MRDTLYTILTAPTNTVREIRSLMEEMDTLVWSLLPGAIRYDTDRVQTSPVDKLAEAMGDLDRMQRKLKALEERKDRERRIIRNLCNKIIGCPDLTDKEREIILDRYADCEAWYKIADRRGISESKAFKLQRSALDKLEAFLEAGANKMQTNIKF